MSVLLTVGLKCTLATSYAGESQWVCQQDRRTDNGRQTITLCFPQWTRPI